MLAKLPRLLIWVAALIVLAATLAPLPLTHQWWIRMWDLPRLHILIVALALTVPALWAIRSGGSIPFLILLTCAAMQAHRIYPFTPLARVEVPYGSPGERTPITFLISNVLMENRAHDRLVALIEAEDPDVLFLMETDQAWADALAPTLERYDTVKTHPTDDHYGLIFASRLPATEAEIHYLDAAETPTLLATMQSAEGHGFHFIGMHPRPPVPGQDTDERDAQLRRAARLSGDSALPVISMGDFNAAGWSWISRRFKHHGEFRDPRVGRGILPSFDAKHPILRFPIDQLYLTEGLDLIEFGRREAIGSDHFPMSAVIAVRGLRPGR